MKYNLLVVHAFAMFVASGCSFTTQLPPRQAPTEELPRLRLPPPPPEAGKGRVALDSMGEDAEVVWRVDSEVAFGYGAYRNAYGYAKTTVPVCRTPCVANLPYGTYKLEFTGEDGRIQTVDLMVGEEPLVVRVRMGRDDPGPGAITSIGTTLMITGGVLGLAAGGVLAEGQDDPLAPGMLVGGLAAFGLGYILLHHFPDVKQQGAVTVFAPADGRVYQRPGG